MRHRRLRGLIALLATPVGRLGVRDRLREKARAVTWPAAHLHRRTLARRTCVVAVTGSYGKTSATRAVAAALGGRPHATLDRNSYAVTARTVLRIRPGRRYAAVETAINGPWQMARVARLLRPDVVVVTAVGSEHNRRLPTLEATRQEKAELVRALPATGLAVLNGDDPNVRWMAGETRARVVTFGLEPGNDVRATGVALDWPHGTRFILEAGEQVRPAGIRLLGRHAVRSALAAVAVALAEGRSLDDVLPALEALPPTPGRLEPVPIEGGAVVLRDDFKSHVETVHAALDVLAEVRARRLVVMGSITEPQGNQHRAYREIGERVGGIAARAVFVGEKIRDYRAGARRAGLADGAIVHAGTGVLEAAEAVRAELRPGDVVLLKGRDSERLERVALSLAGRDVRCDIPLCRAAYVRCADCPMLERGWRGRAPAF